MLKKLQYILDIGSSSLRLIATTKYAEKPRIVCEESVLYDGYMDGDFLSEDKLEDDFSSLIQNMSQKMRKDIKAIKVGVPSEFCVCVCKRISRKFVNAHKITEADMREMYENNAGFGDSEEYSVISYSPLQCVLDDNFKTLSPIGQKTTSLLLDASYILAKRSFMELVTKTLNTLGVSSVDFIPTSLGQAMECEHEGNKPIAIIDVGHISTSVSVYKGEGLALLTSFSMGGGHISSDLMQVLKLNFKDAELIKRKVVLTVESDKNESYEICSKGSLIKAPINLTNQVVKSRIEMIANVIKNILTIDDVFKDIDVYLTGDGLANFKGARNILKDVTGLNFYEYKIPFNNSRDKFQTSKIGLAALVETMV